MEKRESSKFYKKVKLLNRYVKKKLKRNDKGSRRWKISIKTIVLLLLRYAKGKEKKTRKGNLKRTDGFLW